MTDKNKNDRRSLMYNCTDDGHSKLLNLLRLVTVNVRGLEFRNPNHRYTVLVKALQAQIDEYNAKNE